MTPLVSVIVPVYNMEESIEKCVNSLQIQDYPKIEIILIDDGSKDKSLELCRNLADNDSRIQVYHTENRGSGPARNYGILKASGKYVYFMDADDKLLPNGISRMVQGTDDGKYDVVVFGYYCIDPYSNNSIKKYQERRCIGDDMRMDYSEYASFKLAFGVQGVPWNKLWSLEMIKQYGIEFPALRRNQDEGFICRYMCIAKNVHFIPDVLYEHHLNDTTQMRKKFPKDYIDIFLKLREIHQETILSWNPKDIKTKDILTYDYVCNVIKAMELSVGRKEGLAEMKKIVQRASLKDVELPVSLHQYQKLIARLIKKELFCASYAVIKLKTIAEEKGIVSRMKRILHSRM